MDVQSQSGEGTVIRLWLPLFDVRKQRMEHHNLRLVAVSIFVTVVGGVTVLWKDSAPLFLPLVAVGVVLAAFHLFALRKLRFA